jgi:DNA-binding response OmpR family regulator
MKQAANYEPLAIFVDVHLDGKGMGLDFIPKIRSSWPYAAILVVTSDTEPELVGKALAAGANDFVRKPIQKAELLARLKSRLCEMSLRSAGEFVEFGSGRFNVRKRFLEGPAGTVYLSPLQAELMQVLLESEGILVPKEAVKKAIWGKIAVSDNALDRRLSEMRKILKDSGVDMQIVSEYGKGISLQYRGPLARRLISA